MRGNFVSVRMSQPLTSPRLSSSSKPLCCRCKAPELDVFKWSLFRRHKQKTYSRDDSNITNSNCCRPVTPEPCNYYTSNYIRCVQWSLCGGDYNMSAVHVCRHKSLIILTVTTKSQSQRVRAKEQTTPLSARHTVCT